MGRDGILENLGKSIKRYALPFLVLVSNVSSFDSEAKSQRIDSERKVAIYQQGQNHPDFDLDGVVGFSDFIEFSKNFGGNEERYDLTEDLRVNFADFVEFARAYGMFVEIDDTQLLRIEGVLKDNETGFGREGIVNVYDSADSSLVGKAIAGVDGKFDRRFYKKRSELGGILLKAKIIRNDEESYWATFKYPAEDKNGLELRVVPPTGLSLMRVNPEDFYRHAAELLEARTKNRKPEEDPLKWNPIITRWCSEEGLKDLKGRDIPVFKGIVISKTNYDGGQFGRFSENEAGRRKNQFLNKSDMGALYPEIELTDDLVQIVESYPNYMEVPGKVVVYPNNEIRSRGLLGLTRFSKVADYGHGYVASARIEIAVNSRGESLSDYVWAHEIIHTKGLPGHAWALGRENTAMHQIVNSSGPKSPRPADVKLTEAFQAREIHSTGTGTRSELKIYGEGTVLLRDNFSLLEWN